MKKLASILAVTLAAGVLATGCGSSSGSASKDSSSDSGKTVIKAATGANAKPYEGYTMLLVSHEMSFVRNVATRVIFLDGGKILEDGTPREVFGNPKNERVKEFFTKINRMEEPDYSI